MTFAGTMKESKHQSVKEAWQSELGYDWAHAHSGDRRGRCRTHRPPESTMSVGSDIRFTQRKLSRSCRGCCAAIAALLILLLLTAVAVYIGHMYLFGDPLNRQTFRGSFVVSSWSKDRTASELSDIPGTSGNITREAEMQKALDDLYRSSELKSCFVSADVLALDSADRDMRVHFEISFEPIFTAVTTAEVLAVIARQLDAPSGYFENIIVHPETLHIEKSTVISSQALELTEVIPTDAATTDAGLLDIVEEMRQCSPVTLSLCTTLRHNVTSYPNLVGHQNSDALMKDLVAFRELLDAECSHLAQDFVCQMLQPQCEQDRLIRPCRAYCRTFHAGCGSRLPERLRAYFDCAHFPDYFGPGSCVPEPDCTGNLQRLALSRRACDGIPDCAGAEDERSCSFCAGVDNKTLRCALNKHCFPAHLRCDGTPDCPDASDESGCLWITRSLASWRRETEESTMGAARSRAGYAVWAERGRAGKICAAPYEGDKLALNSVATSLCKALTFKSAVYVEVVVDSEHELESENATTVPSTVKELPEYVEVLDPFAPEISFVKSDCVDRQVIKVICSGIECGIPTARGALSKSGIEGLSRSALPGDWPWHAILLRSHVHACDGVLVDPAWLITTDSCFQGQPKAEWIARMGSVRMQSTSPWQQERRVVGMVRSPVEGSMLALIRLEEAFEITDFVRPVCLHEAGNLVNNRTMCNTLGWTRNRDQLQRIHVMINPMNTCENVSIATVNGICAEPLYDKDDCDEEEYAGSSMMCFNEDNKHWSLVGVSGWRIACTKIGLGRPRIYDAISPHIDWIHRTILNSAR